MNYDLREEIRDYWSIRAESYDADFGHGVRAGPEVDAWAALFRAAIGPAPCTVLEVGCGTGEITGVLLSLGHRVTALDFAGPMLARAHAKHAAHPNARLRLGDAERTLEPEAAYDAVICRNLVWTLVDPAAALRDWHRVLRPGGVLLVIDGDWCRPTPLGRLAQRVVGWLTARQGGGVFERTGLAPRHDAIMRRLPFGAGLTIERLAPLVEAAGFARGSAPSHSPIARAQRQGAVWRDQLRTLVYRRFVLLADRP